MRPVVITEVAIYIDCLLLLHEVQIALLPLSGNNSHTTYQQPTDNIIFGVAGETHYREIATIINLFSFIWPLDTHMKDSYWVSWCIINLPRTISKSWREYLQRYWHVDANSLMANSIFRNYFTDFYGPVQNVFNNTKPEKRIKEQSDVRENFACVKSNARTTTWCVVINLDNLFIKCLNGLQKFMNFGALEQNVLLISVR